MPTMTTKQTMHEGILHATLSQIFPNTKIQYNVKKETDAKYPTTKYHMEFDIYISEYNICFEFQDMYHYTPIWYFQNTQEFIQNKDYIKKNMALQKSMSLVVVPFWWNGASETLIAEIKFQRPDIDLPDISHGQFINLNPPFDSFSDRELPDIGELMAPSFPPYHFDKLNTSEWWIGEKYDGVRCFWNSNQKMTYTRSGNYVDLPNNFSLLLPSVNMDCEIWFGRGEYLAACTFARHFTLTYLPMLRLLSFDIPSNSLRTLYEQRYFQLVTNIAAGHPFIILASRAVHKSIFLMVQSVISGSGEGIIMQKRESLYECGRSLSLLKIKVASGDADGVVVGVGLDKSLQLKIPNGTTFTVTTDRIHVTPLPSIGDIVSFSYETKVLSFFL